MEERLDRRGAPPTRVSGDLRLAGLPRDPTTLPELPPSFHAALDRGLAILGVALDPAARAAIEAHVRLLLAWNGAINLTAITDPAAVAVRHVLDSLTAAPLLAPDTARLLDIGSGGGFPGLPLAAALPGSRVTLLDSVAKKAAFLEVAVGGAGLEERVTVRAGRAETLVGDEWDAVVARGVGSLAELVELALPLLRVGGRLIAWKRGELGTELPAAGRAAAALGAATPGVGPAASVPGLEGHVLVEVAKVAPTPAGYPRDPAARRRRPW